MTLRKRLKLVGQYFWGLLSENSTYRGLLLCAAAWAAMKRDGYFDWHDPSLLEAVTWGGLFIVGLINVFRRGTK